MFIGSKEDTVKVPTHTPVTRLRTPTVTMVLSQVLRRNLSYILPEGSSPKMPTYWDREGLYICPGLLSQSLCDSS